MYGESVIDEVMYMSRPYDANCQVLGVCYLMNDICTLIHVERISPLAPAVKHLLGISTASVTV